MVASWVRCVAIVEAEEVRIVCRIYSGEYMLWLGHREDTSVLAMISLRQGLGLVIAKRRKAAGLAQEEFAFHAKVHRTYMTGIERGRHNPSLDVLERIASALN